MNNPFLIISRGAPPKDSLRLNKLAELFKKTEFYLNFVSSITGFEINFSYFEWEYIIEIKNKKGFVVLLEGKDNPNMLRFFVYPKGDEQLLNPTKIINCSGILDDSLNSHFTKFWEDEMSSIYSELI